MSDDVKWIFHDVPRPKWPDKNPKMWLEFSSAPKISILSKLRSSADKPQDSRDLTAWPNSPGAGWVLRHSHDIRSPHEAERFQDIQSQGHFIFEVNMIKPLRYHMGRLWKAHTQLSEFAVVKVALSVRCGLLRTNQPPSMCDEHGSNICALNQACKRRITSSSSLKLCWQGMQGDARPLRLKDVAFCFKRCTACPLMGFRGPNHPAKHFAVDLNRGRGHYQSPELNQW